MSAPEIGDRYGLRTLPTYPYPSRHQTFAVGTKAEAEELRRALPNGEHCEVVRLDPESGPVSDEQAADVGLDQHKPPVEVPDGQATFDFTEGATA